MRPIPSLSRKLVSASSAALATALLSHGPAAQAQSFQANPTAVFGTVDINTGPGATTIDVNSASAVINWLPTDNPVTGQPHNFQPVGTTATFTGTSGVGDFAVLNRIIPTDPSRPIQFNGTVISNLQISSATDPGGNIFFYSPGGIILGSTANFDVGSLALTTLDLEYNDSSGDFDTGGAYVFNPLGSSTTLPLVPGSEVRINAGATIDTTLGGSYVALVAPRVTNNGAITMGFSGSAALVAADSATIRFRPNDFFDIQVASGTGAAGAVLSNSGSVTGPAAGANDINRVYMVAVAKNDAITMAIGSGSTLGFAIAGAANVSGNAVILSGGYDIMNGAPSLVPSIGGGSGQVAINGVNADIASSLDITSSLFARTTGVVNLGASAGSLNFSSDVTIYAGGPSSSLFSDNSGVVLAAGDFLFDVSSTSFTGNALGNDVIVRSNNIIHFGGDVTLTSIGQGSAVFNTGATGGEGAGGSTQISAINGGEVFVPGNVTLDASGLGGVASTADGTGGRGFGGFAEIAATGTGGSSVLISGTASLIADGIGGNGFCSVCVQFGGNGDGGEISIDAVGNNSVTIGAVTTMRATGIGGSANGASAIGGAGAGGQGYITASLGGSVNLHGTTVTVDGNGGSVLGAGQAGLGRGGLIEVSTFGAGASTATFNGTLALAADGRGGQAPSGGSAAGAFGGSILTSAREGSTITVTGDFSQVASGLAGSGFRGSVTGIGGTATLEADTGGTVNVAGNTAFFAIATGGDIFESEGPETSEGGLSEISVNGGTIDLGAQVSLNAYALGGDVSVSGPAGSAQGGTARVTGTTGGTFTTDGFVELNVVGQGGASFGTQSAAIQGGNGFGGNAAFAFTGGLASVGTNLTMTAYGLGGRGAELNLAVTGGNATGGSATLGAGTAATLGNGASVSVLGTTNIDANGIGGDGAIGGTGTGGVTIVAARQGNLALGAVNINTRAEGGDGTSSGAGGAATGGSVQVVAHSAIEGPGQIVTGDLFASTSADGGTALDPDISNLAGGNGGNAQGGSVLVAGSAGNGVLQTGNLSVRAHATGGNGGLGNDARGGNGGNAAAGTLDIGVVSGLDTGAINLGSATFASVVARATGTGGNGGTGDSLVAGAVGGNGGNGIGGGSRLLVEGGTATINGSGSWVANAIGGNGGLGNGRGTGGNATIGSVNPAANAGSSAVLSSRLNQDTQPGVLQAQDLSFVSTASAGGGSVSGAAVNAGSAVDFIAKNSLLSAANIEFVSLAAPTVSAAQTAIDPIFFSNSTATVSGVFDLSTSSATSVTLDRGSLSANILSITAANWVLDPVVPATLGTLNGTSALSLDSGDDLVAHANLATQSGLSLDAAGRIDLGSIAATGLFDALAGTTLSLGDVSAQVVDIEATGVIDVGSVSANHDITAQSLGNITTGNLAAGTGVPTGSNGQLNSIGLRAGGSIATGTIFAGSNLGIVAAGAISTGDATAYDMLLLSGGSVSTGGLNASNRVLIANPSMEAAGGPRDTFNLNLVFSATPVVPTGGPITISGPVTATSFSAATQGAFTSGAITVVPSFVASGNLLVNAGGTLTATDLAARNTLALSAGGAVSTGALASTLQGVSVNALNGSIATGAITARNDVTLGAAQALTVNGAIGARSVFGTSGGDVLLGQIASTGAISLSAQGAMEVGKLNAARDIRLQSTGNLVTGDLAASGGTPTGANGEFNSVNLRSDGSITTRVIFARSNLNIFANGNISTQQATAYDMLLLGGGSVSTTRLNASNRVLMANRSMEAIGQLANGFDANLVFASPAVATVGSISAGAVSATEFTAATRGDFASQSITVLPSATGSGNLLVTADGALNAANLVAANRINLLAGGALRTAALRSDTQGVKVVALGGSATTGAITARNDVLVSTPQALSVFGPINARDVVLLAGGNVSAGAVLAGVPSPSAANPAPGTIPTGRVLIASNSLAAESFLRSASVDYAALLAASPVRTGGTVNVGAVNAGRFVSYSQGAMTGAAITTSDALFVESGGRVTVAQRWFAPEMIISSGDIRIVDNGTVTGATGLPVLSGLRTTPTGSIGLISIGNGPALIGDGLSGTGYALSAAEIGLVSTNELAIGAVDVATNPVDMLIGNLALTAGGSIGTSTVAGANGRVVFGTGNRTTQTPGGAIRITGNVTGSGFAATNIIQFATGRFELDAATGSLALTQTGTALGGTVEIAAANIHIASGTILDRLAADPFYTGHVADLNNAAAVNRPEGVLRALGLDLFPTGTLYIQNTGTILDPAGFFADFELTDVSPPINARPASIAVIVNGKWQTPAGIIGGIAARDLVVNNADDLALYTASSTINGCAFNATSCATTPTPIPTQELDPTPAISGQIAIVSNNVLGNTPQFTPEPEAPVSVASGEGAQATEEAQEEAEAAAAAAITSESATSPIAPPPQMINSAPLEQKPPIDQPVAGSGNPSLIGSAVNENSAEGTAQ